MIIESRPTVIEDIAPISRILEDEWKFHIYSEERWMEMSEYYLIHCLDGADHSETVFVDDEPKGILIIRGLGCKDKLDYTAESSRIYESIKDEHGFKDLEDDMKRLYDTYLQFAEEFKDDRWAELRLVIVSNDCKGTGMGRFLMEEAEDIVTS